jgi:hypothetical protein
MYPLCRFVGVIRRPGHMSDSTPKNSSSLERITNYEIPIPAPPPPGLIYSCHATPVYGANLADEWRDRILFSQVAVFTDLSSLSLISRLCPDLSSLSLIFHLCH